MLTRWVILKMGAYEGGEGYSIPSSTKHVNLNCENVPESKGDNAAPVNDCIVSPGLIPDLSRVDLIWPISSFPLANTHFSLAPGICCKILSHLEVKTGFLIWQVMPFCLWIQIQSIPISLKNAVILLHYSWQQFLVTKFFHRNFLNAWKILFYLRHDQIVLNVSGRNMFDIFAAHNSTLEL